MRSDGSVPPRWGWFLLYGLAFGVVLGVIFGFAHHGGFGWREFLGAVIVSPIAVMIKRAATVYGRRGR